MNKYFKFLSISFSSCFLTLILIVNPTLAGDPFRLEQKRNISDKTEFAFKALFEEGDYQKSKNLLIEASETEKKDPLVYALMASLAYTEKDWESLKTSALETIKVAESINLQDPLRGNLYLAVGNFLEGAYLFQKEGPVAAITKLQDVFSYFDKAEDINSQDPELNLIKGYLNLFLAVKLPFADAEDAIKRLKDYASPQFLVDRGIAIAYRDLKNYSKALEYVNLAIESTPLNPELYYLKGQILRKRGTEREDLTTLSEALKYFDIALEKVAQLPVDAVQKPLTRERRKTQEKIDEINLKKNINTNLDPNTSTDSGELRITN